MISEDSFEVEGGVQFDPSKLDYENPDKGKMFNAVVKMLRKVIELLMPTCKKCRQTIS